MGHSSDFVVLGVVVEEALPPIESLLKADKAMIQYQISAAEDAHYRDARPHLLLIRIEPSHIVS